MRVITKRMLVEQAADALLGCKDSMPEEVYKLFQDRLQKLDLKTCPPEAVDEAFGNSSWTRMQCDECGAHVDWVVELGQEPDYESATACICRSCLNKALLLSFP